MSSSLWKIIRKDGTSIHGLTSAEIRDGIRQGKLDAFDMVQREGSPIVQQIIAIDEIFENTSNQEKDSIYELKKPHAVNSHSPQHEKPRSLESVDLDKTRISGEDLNNMPQPTPKLVNSFPSKSESTSISSNALVKRAPNKLFSKVENTIRQGLSPLLGPGQGGAQNYYLLTLNRKKLGPFSAKAIVNDYSLGRLSKRLSVMKQGRSRAIPIALFAKSYNSPRRRMLNFFPGSPELEVARFWQRDKAIKADRFLKQAAMGLFFLFGFIGALFFGSFLFDALEKLKTIQAPLKERPSLEAVQTLPSASVPLQPPDFEILTEERKDLLNTPPAKSQPPEEKTEQKPAPNKTIDKDSLRLPKTKQTPRSSSTQPKEWQSLRQGQNQSAPQPTAKNRSISGAPRIKTAPRREAPRPVPAQRPVPPPPVNKAKAEPAASFFAANNGKVVNVSKARFNTAHLASCDARCTLIATDSRGQRFEVVFFKEQFSASLLRSGGTATLSGRVNAGSGTPVLYLQQVNPNR